MILTGKLFSWLHVISLSCVLQQKEIRLTLSSQMDGRKLNSQNKLA